VLAVTLQEQLNAFRAGRSFPGAGHAISIERREEWTAAVTEFLRS
jgi:hypothetical protein